MILETVEMRWFWATDDPDPVIRWFTAAEPDLVPDCESRTDRYLMLPEGRFTGIKLREGRLEVKILTAAVGTYELPGALSGSFQRWVKWSLELQQIAGLPDRFEADEIWRQVGKTRLLRQFARRDGTIVELAPGRQAGMSSVCQAELTRISIPGSTTVWLTLGFEADGTGHGPVNSLRSTVRHLFLRQEIPEQLRRAESLSFPEWLADLED